MYKVRFSTKSEGVASIDWEPTVGDGFECSRREALRRWNHLLDAGLRGDAVDGAVPWLIEIVNADNDELMLGITTEKDEAIVGKWARELVDEYRAKLQRYEEAA